MTRLLPLAFLTVLAFTATLLSAEGDDVLALIDRMVSSEENADRSLGRSIAEGIEKSPGPVSAALAQRLKDKHLTERQLTVYVWALGWTKDQARVPQIEAVYDQSKSPKVRTNCLSALARIGGQEAEQFLLSSLDAATTEEQRFDILNRLGQMQCEAALPKAEALLKLDPKELCWQCIFVFGKMGDKAVPFLLKRIDHEDRNVRLNAIGVLGVWLIPPDASKPLQDRFWEEKDVELRDMILGAVARTTADPEQTKAFLEQVAAKEADQSVIRSARAILKSVEGAKAAAATFGQGKQPAASDFQRAYGELYKSAGKEGSYELLGTASTAADEPKLKALRARILQRDSDESFDDYQRVNTIIMQNRMLAKSK